MFWPKLAQLRSACLLLSSLLLAAPAVALTFAEASTSCPLDGTPVRLNVMRSGSAFCARLDTKPVGMLLVPGPIWDCPVDGFVWIKGDLDERERVAAQAFVASPEYQRLVATESSYFRLGAIYEAVGRDPRTIAQAFLQASWEVEADEAQYARYLERVLHHLEEALRADGAGDPGTRLLAAELERRLGRTVEAQSRLVELEAALQVREAAPDETRDLLLALVKIESKLVAKGDRLPHYRRGTTLDDTGCRGYDRIGPYRRGLPVNRLCRDVQDLAAIAVHVDIRGDGANVHFMPETEGLEQMVVEQLRAAGLDAWSAPEGIGDPLEIGEAGCEAPAIIDIAVVLKPVSRGRPTRWSAEGRLALHQTARLTNGDGECVRVLTFERPIAGEGTSADELRRVSLDAVEVKELVEGFLCSWKAANVSENCFLICDPASDESPPLSTLPAARLIPAVR